MICLDKKAHIVTIHAVIWFTEWVESRAHLFVYIEAREFISTRHFKVSHEVWLQYKNKIQASSKTVFYSKKASYFCNVLIISINLQEQQTICHN